MAQTKITVLDVTVIKAIRNFEFTVYKYIDDTMKFKFKSTLVRQLVNTLGDAREAAIEGMDLPKCFRSRKYERLSTAQAKLHNAECLLNYLNDLQQIGDTAKARFDMQLADIYGQLERLLNSFAKGLNGSQQSEGTPTDETHNFQKGAILPEG